MLLVVFLFALWAGLGVWRLTGLGLSKRHFWICCAALAAALLLRISCMEHITSDYTGFLSQWAQFFRENGGFAGIKSSVGDYNVPYLYFLAAISYLPVRDLYLIKLFSIFFDLLLAFTGLRLARRLFHSDVSATAAFCALLLLPTVVLNGAYWGQCDSIYATLTLLALLDALDGRPARSVVWLGVAFSFKLQTIFLIPLWCVLWYSDRVRFKHLLHFPAAYFGAILPALLLGKPLGDILGVYFKQMGEYNTALAHNAPSIFALFPGDAQMDVAFWAKVGIIAAFALVLGLLLALFFFRKRLTDGQVLAAGLILAIGVPLLLPFMHDRYFFLAEVLAVVWCVGDLRRLPVPAAVQTAALGGYHAYLKGRYAFPMAWGAWMMLGSLLAVIGWLCWSLIAKKANKAPELT